jgi:EmrB/QacA subfamily drug resistance transporter
LVEPPRPRRVAQWPEAAWLVVATVSVGAFMGQLDASIVNLAYPSLQQAFGTTVGAVQWVGLSYLMVLIVGVAAVGRVADMLGRKLLYMYGFLVFGLGSALCAAAPSLLFLDVFRLVQAVGAVMLQANSLAIIASSLSRGRLGRGIGVQGTAQALGLGCGPLVGGVLIGLGGWRLIFLVNVPIGIAGAVTAWLFVPRSRDLSDQEPFDWLGVALLAAALVALLLALSFGNTHGWGSPAIIAAVATAIGGTVGFVRRERSTEYPLVNLDLFRRRRFSVGVSAGLCSFLVLFGVLFVTPFELERAHNLSPGAAGLLIALLPLAMAVAAPFAGRAEGRVGARPPTVAGMLIAGAGLALMVATTSTQLLAVALFVVGVGVGLFTPANNASTMSSVPRTRVGIASGVLNLSRGLGTALGLTLTALVFDVASAGSHTQAETTTGFTHAITFLCVVALATAGLAALRRPRSQERLVE